MGLPNRKKSIDYTQSEYGSIGSVYITGAGFIHREFKGVSPNSSFGWQELVWEKTPSRGADFKFTNMNDIPVGLVARCEIDVSFMTPDDYRDMRLILKQRHFWVTFYDMDEQKWYTRDMYCTESSKSKFLILDKSILGTVDVKLKFVGTNLDTEIYIDDEDNEITQVRTFDITYIEYIDSTLQTSRNKKVNYASQVILESTSLEETPTGYYLDGWVTKDDGENITGYYGLGQSITVWKNLTLYPNFVLAENEVL